MKKYLFIELIVHVITIVSFILYLVLNNISNKMNIYLNFNLFIGLLLPLIHLVFILIKEVANKEYKSKRFDSFTTYFLILVNGFCYVVVNNSIKEDIFNKIYLLFYLLLIFFDIIVFVSTFLYIKYSEKKNKNNIKVK